MSMFTNELLTNRFHVTHFGGCAVLFNEDTSFPDVKVKSIYLHDIRRVASFRRQLLSGQKSFTVMSLHTNNRFAKKRGIGKKLILTVRAVMLEHHVDVVSMELLGDATTATVSVPLKRPLPNVPCRCLPAPHHCGVHGRFRVRGKTCVDSSTTRIQMEDGKFVSMVHSPFLTWLHLDFVERRSVQSRKTRSTTPLERTLSAAP